MSYGWGVGYLNVLLGLLEHARMAQWQRISLVMRRSVVQIRVRAGHCPTRWQLASVPERSKGFDSSSNVFVLVGSNPTGCTSKSKPILFLSFPGSLMPRRIIPPGLDPWSLALLGLYPHIQSTTIFFAPTSPAPTPTENPWQNQAPLPCFPVTFTFTWGFLTSGSGHTVERSIPCPCPVLAT